MYPMDVTNSIMMDILGSSLWLKQLMYTFFLLGQVVYGTNEMAVGIIS